MTSPERPMAPMHVALNALFLAPGHTGGAEFVFRRLVPALLAAAPSLQLTVFATQDAAPELRAEFGGPRCVFEALPVQGSSRIRRSLVEQALLPRRVGRTGADLLHNLATTAPFWCPVPQITTILDLNFRHTKAHTATRTAGIAALARLSARASARVITISHFVAADVTKVLGVPRDTIDVTWLGPGLSKASPAVSPERLRADLRLDNGPLLLCPASARPHKNVPRLIQAFARLSHPATLVLTGVSTGFEDQIERAVMAAGVGDRVRCTGWVEDATLAGLYGIADLLVFPSLAEGFGLPLVEAMTWGVPVVCSDRTSLPEVGGDAAAYFNPESVEDIARVLDALLDDPARRQELAMAGAARASQFTWERTARATIASYQAALGRAPRVDPARPAE